MHADNPAIPDATLGPTRVGRIAVRAGRVLGRADHVIGRARPWMVLGPLVVGTWVVMVTVGVIAQHSGWIYYHGGDGTWYYTSAWVLGHGHVPDSSIGYGYSLLLAPLVAIGGPSMLTGMPLVILFNALVLAPIALFCVYGLVRELAGRRLAYVASAFWVVLPLLAIPDFYPRYHGRYISQTLPAVTGLTPLGDYPTMVLLLASAYFAFRAIAHRSGFDALIAGLAAGFAIAVKPANAIFLPAPLLALAFTRRPREVLVFAGGLIPSLLGLVLWKYRGLGYIPAFSSPPAALAAGATAVPPLGGLNISHYLTFNWGRLTHNIDGIREFTWTLRLTEWVILAGLIGLARRSVAAAVLVGGWLASYLLLKGSSPVADIYGGGFFRYLSPAFPAVILLAASVPFLVPVWGRRLAGHRASPGWPATVRARKSILIVAGFVSALPILLFVAFRPLSSPTTTIFPNLGMFVPSEQFPLEATITGTRVTLTWPRQPARGARIAYGIFRGNLPACGKPANAARSCELLGQASGIISRNRWVAEPGPGSWSYQIGVLVSPFGDPAGGDYVLLSQVAGANVP